MTTSTPTQPAMLVATAEVVGLELLSPSFVRVELGGPGLADLGVPTPSLDQRIKLVFPARGYVLPDLAGAGDDWYAVWCGLPEDERGSMRTYTVRTVRDPDGEPRLVVDFVLHGRGAHGPGGDWVAAAQVGDRLVVVAPRRGGLSGGIEFAPHSHDQLLLAGDETAVPAIAAILEQLPAEARGAAFLEVPEAADRLDLACPTGVDVVWLPREGGPRGADLHPAVLAHLGVTATSPVDVPDHVDPDLWETPTWSSSGEEVSDGPSRDSLYAWIAGEARVVTTLRRALVKDVGIERGQVAFMGYWRDGVAMMG